MGEITAGIKNIDSSGIAKIPDIFFFFLDFFAKVSYVTGGYNHAKWILEVRNESRIR